MKKLELIFENEEGKTAKISLDNPAEPIDAQLVSDVMDTVIAENALITLGGEYVAKKGARLVETTVETVELV